ncbi:Murein DD-endopeptidase MepH [Tepidimonas alkaliphilus]|uniref:Murein DD-endopeptidase MepH n=2 Tax=Tepidimonas alkaliphilus TaxID=2588942 RepID=A0A554W764_9BURK|nr:Murein DD-endopeptidase MepH [Tepidimonas alkaliphilus]
MIAWVALACSVQAAPQGEDSEAAVLGASSAETAPAVWMQRLQTMGSETGAVASQLLDTALSLVGVPYRKGGNSPQVGFDCSGFVRYVYGQALGLALPRRAVEQAQSATPISRDELRPGDLVFFNTMRRAFSHVGVYLGDGKFVHAPRKGDHVKVSDMNERYWAQRYNGARRIEWSDAQALRMLPQAAGAWLTAPPSRER